MFNFKFDLQCFGGRGASIGRAVKNQMTTTEGTVPKVLQEYKIPSSAKKFVEDNIHELVDPHAEAACQRSSISVEFALRGYAVEPVSNDFLDTKYGGSKALNMRSLNGIKSWFKNPEVFTVRKGPDIWSTDAAVRDALLKRPVGQRFLVSSGTGNKYAGHTVHAEIIMSYGRKTVLYRDGYDGTSEYNDLPMARYMHNGSRRHPTNKITIIRTDNAVFTDKVTNMVTASERLLQKIKRG